MTVKGEPKWLALCVEVRVRVYFLTLTPENWKFCKILKRSYIQNMFG